MSSRRTAGVSKGAGFTGGVSLAVLAAALASGVYVGTVDQAGGNALLTATAAEAHVTVGGIVGAIRPLMGINIGPLGNDDQPPVTEAYRARGITLIRTHDYYGPLDLATMYPDRSADPQSPASFVFTAPVSREGRSSDAVFASIVDNGFEPYFRLGDSWNNARAPSPGEIDHVVAASVNILRHYREGLWNGFRSAFRYVEIWNEPDGRQFWAQPAPVYRDFYARVTRAIRQAFPDVKLGGPGVTPAGCLAPGGRAWTEAFLDQVRATGAPLDFFSWHMYTNDPRDYETCAAFYRQALDARGFAAVPMHVTEWNTESSGGPGGVELRARARGAAINTAAWMLMQVHGIEESLFYRGPEPNPDLPSFYGMFFADGRPKAIGLAASLWHEIGFYPLRRTTTGGAEDFWVLAGSNTAGGLAVLVANTSNTTRTWALDGDAVPAGAVATVQTVSDEADRVVTTTTAARSFTLPAYGVQLVTLRPVTTALSTCAPSRSVPGTPVTDPNGPYFHRVAIGRLDGQGRVASHTHILDHASVPDGVQLPDGRLLIYYVNGQDGATWVARWHDGVATPLGPIVIEGVSRPGGVVDPDVSIVHGRVRLAYFVNSGGSRAMCLAESTNAIDFRVIGVALPGESEIWTDPSVVPLRDGRWLMAVSAGPQTILARSADGYSFTAGERLPYGGVPEVARLADGRLALYVCARGIQRYVSADEGHTWTYDTATLELPGLLCDPSHVAGTDLFVFKTGF